MLKQPFTAIVSGPTGCGKTTFIAKLIRNSTSLISPPPTSILYCYGAWQEEFNDFEGVEFNEGLPDKTHLLNGRLIIIDDLMSEADQRVESLFTKHSHHLNVLIIFISPNFFNKYMRTITLNAHYLFLFKSLETCRKLVIWGHRCICRKQSFSSTYFTMQSKSRLRVSLSI